MTRNQKICVVQVATAGIGRMSFGAWIPGESVDRSDGDDEGTYRSMTDAAVAAGERLEIELMRAAWSGAAPPFGRASVARGDVQEILIQRQGDRFLARWGKRTALAERPVDALRELCEAIELELTHRAWVIYSPDVEGGE